MLSPHLLVEVKLEPGVVQSLSDFHALYGIALNQPVQEVETLDTQTDVKPDFTSEYQRSLPKICALEVK